MLISLFIYTGARAQEAGNPSKREPMDYMFRREMSGGVKLCHNGFTVYAQYGWIKNIRQTQLVEVEYFYHHDFRNKKVKAPISNGRDYYFGVQNRFHNIRLSYVIKRAIVEKADKKGVRLSFAGTFGFSLGLLKPYYLSLAYFPDSVSAPVFRDERYSASNDDRFLDRNYIAEASPSYLGLNQIEPVPGGHVKLALDFDWGSRDAFIKAVETGVILDVYYKRLPILINDTNRMYMASFFVSCRFGKRW